MIAHWREREQGGEGCGWRGQQIERERESWDDGRGGWIGGTG